MELNEIISREHEVVMPTYSRFNLALDHGEGALLYDVNGKEYIDLTSGIGVNSLGHNHPILTKNLENQIHKVLSTSNLYYTLPMIEAAEKVVANSGGMQKMFFANSGAEANEGAIKVARKYAADKYGKDRYQIITLTNSFHGRTIATLEATGQDHFHQNFFPFTNGFVYTPANDIDALKEAVNDQTAAIMVELIQGESGVRPLEAEFVKAIEELCNEKDILFIVDEVQTGIGRTGNLFCYQNYDILPDIVTMAKGLGAGVPIGGFLTGEKTSGVLKPGDHGTTFGGNPLAATAANTVMDIVADPEFLAEVNHKGKLFRELLNEIDSENVLDVRGQGLMIGIQVPAEKIADLIQKCMDQGVLVLKAGKDTIRLLPPLVISEDQIRQAASIIKGVIEE